MPPTDHITVPIRAVVTAVTIAAVTEDGSVLGTTTLDVHADIGKLPPDYVVSTWDKAEPTPVWESDLQLVAEAHVLNDLPEVIWDRCAGTDDNRLVFGWLPRKDGARDFVALIFTLDPADGSIGYQLLTSSAKYSAEFARRLNLDHSDCQTVDAHYGDEVTRRLIHPADPELQAAPADEIGGAFV